MHTDSLGSALEPAWLPGIDDELCTCGYCESLREAFTRGPGRWERRGWLQRLVWVPEPLAEPAELPHELAKVA